MTGTFKSVDNIRTFRLFGLTIITLILLSTAAFAAGTPSNSATLTWTAPGDDGNTGQAVQYDIRYATFNINDSNWDQCIEVLNPPLPQPAGSAESFVLEDLQPSTTYYFAIKTTDEAGNWSLLSNVYNITTEAETDAPLAVSDFSVINPNSTSLELSWTAVGDDGNVGTASTYDIRISTSPISAANWDVASQLSGEPAPQAAGSQETLVVSGLSSNATYYFAMKVADEVPNWSDLSNVASGSTSDEDIAPLAVSDFSADNPTSTSIQLTWTAVGDDNNSGTASGYDIRYSTSPISDANWAAAVQVNGEPTPQSAGNAESFTVTNLASSTNYFFAIKVSDEVPNVSALSNIAINSTTVEQVAPSVVADLITLDPTDSSITLSWTAVGDDGNVGTATTYDIRYSTALISAANWDQATQIADEPTPLAAGTEQSYTVQGLNVSTTYYFAVKVSDEVPNWSGMSAVAIRATTADVAPPAAIIDLQAQPGSGDGEIDISWTPPEGIEFFDDNGAQASPSMFAVESYQIKWSTEEITEDNWDSIVVFWTDSIPNLTEVTPSTATISGLEPGIVHYVAVKTMDADSNLSDISNVAWTEARINIVTDVDDSFADLPETFELSQNYPNPFNPTTSFDYSVPSSSHVSIAIYNSNGQVTSTLVDGVKSAGLYTANWDGTNNNNQAVASGIYFYRIESGDFSETKKMVLLK